MGGANKFFADIGQSIETAAKTTEYNLTHGIGKRQQKATTNRNIQVNSGQPVEVGKSSRKFGEGGVGPDKSRSPGYFDPRPAPAPYSGPALGGQLDLGRPGDPSNPLPPPIVPWDNSLQGQAPDNPPAWSATLPSYTAQIRRLKYRKYAKERGL